MGIAVFTEELLAAGLPVTGIGGFGPECQIHLDLPLPPADASDEERQAVLADNASKVAQARVLAQTFDWAAQYRPDPHQFLAEIASTGDPDAFVAAQMVALQPTAQARAEALDRNTKLRKEQRVAVKAAAKRAHLLVE